MSLSFYLYNDDEEILSLDISHNAGEMAEEIGIYKFLWHPEKNGIKKASQLIPILQKAIEEIGKREDFCCTFEKFVTKIFIACIKNPNARIEAQR